jgi:lipoprotein-anchoring transpeptidase ErfK/SrfK
MRRLMQVLILLVVTVGSSGPVADTARAASIVGDRAELCEGGCQLAEGDGGHWVRVDLSRFVAQAMVGNQVVYSAPITAGTADWPTPRGRFQILRRVYDETMDSSTIGIPRFSPGGYYLTGVLYTQYFTSAGHSLHYNYWSPPALFGRAAGSHGCVGLTLDAAAYFWRFATVGTPVVVG